MKRPVLSFGLACSLAFLALASIQTSACFESHLDITCPKRYHPNHTDEYGEPDPCCTSAVPCCSNPLWGRKIISSIGAEMDDPCCLAKACPEWDPNAGSDAGTDATSSGEGTKPTADGGMPSEPDAGP